MKNIVVITGSSRRGGNSELMARAFIEGAQQTGHNVFLFETLNKKLSCCIACDNCFSKGQACSMSDDFNELAPILENADTIVFCTPLYWFTFPAKIKIVIDKLYSFIIGRRELKINESALMVCAETNKTEDFEGIIKTYELILDYKKWRNAGILTVPNVYNIGDIKKTDGLIKAKEMGINI
ncbi:MAG: flavodoxin family protein [Treponema sp.]|jgi:multimeric flavodoxin WrbA|nr:flavodoxin family protein [Treponema sp.]